MSGLGFLALISAIVFAAILVWLIVGWVRYGDASMIAGILAIFIGMAFLFLSGFAIAQPISIRNTLLRQEKERTQIEYQIALVEADPTKDKIKLNEWILTYNDWVNDVETSQEIYGWFSWYYGVDMTGIDYIPLV